MMASNWRCIGRQILVKEEPGGPKGTGLPKGTNFVKEQKMGTPWSRRQAQRDKQKKAEGVALMKFTEDF